MDTRNQSAQEQAISFIKSKASGSPATEMPDVTVNFHPDRITTDGTPILSAMASDGLLKSQFQTGTSNGGLSAYPGGDRWQWEHRAFNGAYDNSDPAERPKYGALNYRGFAAGGSTRFGSACFRMKSHVLERTTFCYPDSSEHPEDFATYENISHLIEMARSATLDLIDNHIEAHIHGSVRLDEDVDALVLDPVYMDTEFEQQARSLPCRIEWHRGFRLEIRVVEQFPDYRGAEYVTLARKLAVGKELNPLILCYAIKTNGYDQQDVNKVWHYLARFGDLNNQP